MVPPMSEVKIGKMMIGSVQTNFYFVYREGSKDIICIDPADHGEQIYQKLTEEGFIIRAILLTHGHFDHIFGCKSLKKLSEAPIYAYMGEKSLLEDPALNVSDQVGRPYTVKVDHYLEDGAVIESADIKIKLIATPGHTAGSCCYYIEDAGLLISGDTLFEESVGRSDLPTGNGALLGRSVTEKLFVLPEETRVYPGHGDATTIGHEKQYNPFF